MTTLLLPVPVDHDQDIVPADLIQKARDYAAASKARATLKTYATEWRTFTTWCSARGLSALPASPCTVAAYVADRAEAVRVTTIKKGLAAVAQAHRLAGVPSPTTDEAVRLTLQGLRRLKGTAACPRKALRVDHLRQMLAILPDSAVGVRDRALLLLGFSTGMRRSELVALDVADVTFEPEGAVITIRRGKTDQQGQGRQVAVPFGHAAETCPVRAIRRWLEVSGVQGGLFVRLDPGSLPVRLDGRAVAEIVKRRAQQAGLDPSVFSGHSLRRGYCTETARLGARERDIARTTGHRSMVVLRRYVEAGTLFQNCAASVLPL